MKMNNNFSKIIRDFFEKHLKLERMFSSNTYIAYLSVIKQFIAFLEIKGYQRKNITINDINKENVLNFLHYTESEMGCSTVTRNHKLAVINSFLQYAQSIDPTYLNTYIQVKGIKFKKSIKKKMDFMTIDELEIFFRSIDLKHKSGYKHYVILSVLYETGARVSELINITIDNLFFNETSPYIKILGKGNKERIVFINNNIVSMINEYIEKFGISDGFLFINHSGTKYSRFGINKLIDKYAEIAKKSCLTLRNKTITPHTFRHSKAVHFLENGTALPIIQRFLGHASVQTTEIYLDVTNSVVADSIKKASDLISPEKSKPMWKGDDDLINLLESLSK